MTGEGTGECKTAGLLSPRMRVLTMLASVNTSSFLLALPISRDRECGLKTHRKQKETPEYPLDMGRF